MKHNWKRVGLIAALVAVVGVAAVGAMAFAQSSDDDAGWPYNFRDRFREAIADVLGITVDEYNAAVETAQDRVIDKSLADGWLTEDQAEALRERADDGFGFGRMPFGRGGRGFRMGGTGDSLLSVAAEQLGMDATDLLDRLQDGESIADVAEAQGVDPQSIVDAYVAQMKEKLDDAVADEDITQKQADAMLQNMQERIADQVENSGGCLPFGFEGRMPGRMGGPGRGGMRGWFDDSSGSGLRGPADTGGRSL
jgi:hypothetical protein